MKHKLDEIKRLAESLLNDDGVDSIDLFIEEKTNIDVLEGKSNKYKTVLIEITI